MTDDQQLIERTLNVMKACLVPSLDFDFNSQPIGKEDFSHFHEILDDQLHLLLDILYQNGNLLRNTTEIDSQLTELKTLFIVLSCEQTEPNHFFQTEQKILISTLKKLLDDNFGIFPDNIIKSVISYYKEKLAKDSWKRNFGSIFGFARFCEILLDNRVEFANEDFLLFALSVGSSLLTVIDPQFRSVGLKIYRFLMTKGDKEKIQSLNIHQVVHSESFELIRKSSEVEFNDHLFEVLYETSRLENYQVKSSKWCKFDDIMNEILEKVGLESENQIFLLLLKKIVKFCAITYEKVENFDDLESLKNHTNIPNYRTMRWIKKLTEMIIRESIKIFNNLQNGIEVLHSFHCIYIISFSNIESDVLGEKFTEFTQKFILVLMQTVNNYKNNEIIRNSTLKFLETIKNHQNSNTQLTECINKLIEKLE